MDTRIEANSFEWHQARVGKWTASHLYDLICTPKKRPRPYVMQTLAERLTGESQEDFYESADIAHGVENESRAFTWLEKLVPTVTLEDSSYFQQWDEVPTFGATCDRVGTYAGEPCIFEVKCPKTTTHLRYCLMESVEDLKKEMPKYYWQIVAGCIVHGIDRGMFVSFDPRVDDECGLYYLSFIVPESDIDVAKEAIRKAEAELQELKTRLNITQFKIS